MRLQLLLITLCIVIGGCLTPKAHENPKTADELRVILQDFHMKLRWSLWEQAAAYTAPAYRNEFLGRYEELGDDFKIVNLEIKQVTLGDPISTVDVEQEWYLEPNMVVQKKRYIESWVTVNGTWLIAERIPKEEWRERQKRDDAAPAPPLPPAEEPQDEGEPAPESET